MNDKSFDKPIQNADDWTARDIFDNLDERDKILMLFNQLEHSYDQIFELQQKVADTTKKSSIQLSMIEMLIEESGWYGEQLGSYGKKPKLFDELKNQVNDDFVPKKRIAFYDKKEWCVEYKKSPKTFERWKKSGEIKVTTIGGSDYVLIEDMHARFKQGG
jgi:hypothetical protein